VVAIDNKFNYTTDKNETVSMIIPSITMNKLNNYDTNMKKRRTPINDTNYEQINMFLPYVKPETDF